MINLAIVAVFYLFFFRKRVRSQALALFGSVMAWFVLVVLYSIATGNLDSLLSGD